MAGTYWRNGSPTLENEAHDRAADRSSRLRPFEMKIGGVETFLPDTAVIYLHIEPTPELLAVRGTLLRVIGQDKQRHFTPHLTLTMRLDARQTEALLKQLQQTAWLRQPWSITIDHLWLMQRGPNDPAWRYIHRDELLHSGAAHWGSAPLLVTFLIPHHFRISHDSNSSSCQKQTKQAVLDTMKAARITTYTGAKAASSAWSSTRVMKSAIC
jgi:hypothetical protein